MKQYSVIIGYIAEKREQECAFAGRNHQNKFSTIIPHILQLFTKRYNYCRIFGGAGAI